MNSPTLTVNVLGVPIPQGSARAFTHPGTGRPIITAANPKTKAWRQEVSAAAFNATAASGWTKLADPVLIDITFHMPRPKSHYGSGRNAHRLKPSAPAVPSTKPDLDKLTRAILDSLTDAGVFVDDAQVTDLLVRKRYANGPTGARIIVSPLPEQVTTTSPSAAAETPTEQGALL